MPRHRRGWSVEGGPHCTDRHSPLIVSMLEPTLLVLIQEQCRHGYNLMSELGRLGMGSLHPSVVYRTLRDMEDLEWIRSDWDAEQTQGPPRRVYRLMPLGEEVLQGWKRELVKTRNLIDELMEKIRQ